jgi:ribosomal protein L32
MQTQIDFLEKELQKLEVEYLPMILDYRKKKRLIFEKAKETLTEEQVCINCDEQKMTHEICMDCIGKMIKENQVDLYTEEQVINIIDNVSPNWYKSYTEEDKKAHLLKLKNENNKRL